MSKRKSSAPSPAPNRTPEQVTILVGMHKGETGMAMFYDTENVLVDIHDMPHSYRHEDVERIR